VNAVPRTLVEGIEPAGNVMAESRPARPPRCSRTGVGSSILAELGVPPRRAMYLLGHRDPKFTMRTYQQVLNMGGGAEDQLESALGCTCGEAFVVLTGRDVRGLIEDPAAKMPRNVTRGPSVKNEKAPQMRGFSESG
jgi:hypothetical protein